ncbi:hypothetical protein GCM10027452_40150 [Micromonospora halotolerans]
MPVAPNDVRPFAALDDTGYTGWLVVEQDAPEDGRDLDRIRADQHANRRWLEEALR